jgi:hypothetical protein
LAAVFITMDGIIKSVLFKLIALNIMLSPNYRQSFNLNVDKGSHPLQVSSNENVKLEICEELQLINGKTDQSWFGLFFA